jgi:hypothetical protein
MERLNREDLVLLAQDTEFSSIPPNLRGVVIISRVKQERPIRDRVRIWMRALDEYFEAKPPEKLFEIDDDGTLGACKIWSS